jgi:hypothetical protein
MKTLTTEQIETLKTMDWQDDRGEDLTGALLYFSNTNDSYFQDITGVCVSCLRELLGSSNTMESFYWEIAYRYHKKNALADAFYDLHYAIWYKGVVKDGVIQEFDTDILGLFTEEKPGTDWETLLGNAIKKALAETDVDSIVEFIDNNYADVSNKIRENFSENLEVDDIEEVLKDDIAKDWIEQNYDDAYDRAVNNMDSYEMKDKIIDYLQNNL